MIDSLVAELRQKGTVTFTVRARPGSSKTEVKEILDDGSVKIAVAAAPEKGKANRELVIFLADVFDVPKANIEIVAGETSGVKLVRIVV
jgi:hypothetical protein